MRASGKENTLCKTAQQFSRRPLSAEEMGKLRDIAMDARAVKNYVYRRYGGVKSIGKLYSGYTVQNEMTACGLREELGLPSAFYYSAMNDALADIRAQWTRVVSVIRDNARRNPGFCDGDRHYIRFVLKFESCYANIFNGMEPVIDDKLKDRLDALRNGADCKRLDGYMRRQARRHEKKLRAVNASGFSVTEKGYRYGDHGIYITTKERRKRIYVELTDTARYGGRLYILLDEERRMINIKAPVYVHIKNRGGRSGSVGLSLGVEHMLTTDAGNVYGAEYGAYHRRLVGYVKEKGGGNRREKENNPGSQKYSAGKRRLEEGLHNYVNREVNRLLREEKPGAVCLPKLPPNPACGGNRQANASLTMWQRGYVTERIRQKCLENGILFVEVFGKDIGKECSACGGKDFTLKDGLYICGRCALEIDSRRNAAINALRRGERIIPEP